MESLQKRWNDSIGTFTKQDASVDTNIKSAQIVYVVGRPGTGKSFTGDYMHVVHGYHHVDGDIPAKHMTLVPEYKEIIEKWLIDDDGAPHFSELARLTLEAAKSHDKVVLSHASFKNKDRDHVVKKLIEGGAIEDNITLIQLTIDPKVKARGLYYRTKRQAEQAGITITDLVKAQGAKFEGELTEEMYVEIALQQVDKLKGTRFEFEVHPDSIMVDVSGRDVTHLDNIDRALGLTRSNNLTYEGICAEVFPFDVARDEKAAESGQPEAIAEVFARIAAKLGDKSLVIDEEGEDEKKVDEMKRRRSSLVQLERSIRSLSVRSESESEELKKSRKSFIKTGKFDEE